MTKDCHILLKHVNYVPDMILSLFVSQSLGIFIEKIANSYYASLTVTAFNVRFESFG
jgi:hypothetical protein